MKIIQSNNKYQVIISKNDWLKMGQKFSEISPIQSFNKMIKKIRDKYQKGIIKEDRDGIKNYELTDEASPQGTQYIQLQYDYWENIIQISKYYESEYIQNEYGETYKFKRPESDQETFEVISKKFDEFLIN